MHSKPAWMPAARTGETFGATRSYQRNDREMPRPIESLLDDQQLIDYALGLLTEIEAERLDEASITDDEIAVRLCSVEDDLVDAYVTGTLDQRTRENFEATYLKSPRRREKVKFARRFLTVVDRASAGYQV